MMAVFPNYAKILLEGYSESPDYGVLRTEMDGGIAKQRSRWSKPIVTRNARLVVKGDTDKENFDLWIESIGGGAGWFDFKVPKTERIIQARIVEGKYEWETAGNEIWFATCQIESLGW